MLEVKNNLLTGTCLAERTAHGINLPDLHLNIPVRLRNNSANQG
jgi:hypothetical protein